MNLLLLQGILHRPPFSALKKLEKWTALYMMLEADELGIFAVDRELLPIQIGVPIETIDSAIEKLADDLVADGEHHWFRHLIHEQYGRRPESLRWNRTFPTLIKKLVRNNIPSPILSSIIAEYPVFEEHYIRFRDEGIEPAWMKPKPKKKSKDSPP